ncbi:hypothetical protein HRbin29_01745 [bacterium HR29]|jgi:hypothetical protein|nr:hypothetical protein HRbin29_01745 [bacterium HR29]
MVGGTIRAWARRVPNDFEDLAKFHFFSRVAPTKPGGIALHNAGVE